MGSTTKELKTKKSGKGCQHAAHPDHSQEIPRMRRIRGQMEGVERMIEDGRYCIDILHQLKAVRAALQSLESSILKTHLRSCVRDAMSARDLFDADKKIQEISELLVR